MVPPARVESRNALKVSVALCTHNGAPYIEDQLVSIFTQSSVPDELIISDDASTDGTLDIVRRACLQCPVNRVVIRRNAKALGVTRNFESAVRKATGDIVLLSDQDDMWMPERVSKTVAAFASDSSLLFVHGDAYLVDAQGKPIGHTLFESLGLRKSERREISTGHAFATYLRRNLAVGATSAFRRDLLDRALPFPDGWLHDEWLAAIAAATGKVDLLEGFVIDYRQHGQNQVGVPTPTLRYRARRALAPEAERNERLAVRSRVLADRLASLGVSPAFVAAAERKAAFERRRADLPSRRIARIPRIARDLFRGEYGRYASQRAFDVIRDLARPGADDGRAA